MEDRGASRRRSVASATAADRTMKDLDAGLMDTAMRASGSIAWIRRWRRASGIIAAMVAIAWTRGRSLRRSVRVGAARGARSKLSETFLIRGCPHESLQSHFEGRAHLADGDDDGLEAESQDSRSECRRCREQGYIERGVDQEGHETEDSPEAPRAVRARGEEALGVQGVRCLSARTSAL